MREIKFKAWDLKEKVMREVNDICFLTGSITCNPLAGHDNDFELYDPICFKGKYKLMQYTGLKDKNGVEIYEGDFLKVYEISESDEYEFTAPVIWKDFSWILKENENVDAPLALYDNSLSWVGKDSEIEIVGNIHENPELVK